MHFNLTLHYMRANVEVLWAERERKKNGRKYLNSTSKGRSSALNSNGTMVTVQMRSNYVDSGENWISFGLADARKKEKVKWEIVNVSMNWFRDRFCAISLCWMTYPKFRLAKSWTSITEQFYSVHSLCYSSSAVRCEYGVQRPEFMRK